VSGPLPEDELGGDPPCWAAQFEEPGPEGEPEAGDASAVPVDEEDGPGT
jgi:hypothetical protein